MSLDNASKHFGISKRTIERRLADGTIGKSQTEVRDGKRYIYVAELLRVFGEPGNRPETDKAGMRATAPTALDVTDGAERSDHIKELRDRAERAERLADAERERADKYERERDELRIKNDELVTRLLPPPASAKRSGWFGGLFGR